MTADAAAVLAAADECPAVLFVKSIETVRHLHSVKGTHFAASGVCLLIANCVSVLSHSTPSDHVVLVPAAKTSAIRGMALAVFLHLVVVALASHLARCTLFRSIGFNQFALKVVQLLDCLVDYH